MSRTGVGEVKIFCDGTELKGVENWKAVFVVVVYIYIGVCVRAFSIFPLWNVWSCFLYKSCFRKGWKDTWHLGSDKNVLNKNKTKNAHFFSSFETIQSTPLRVNQITSVIGDELLVYRWSPVTIVNGAVSRIVSFYTHNSSQGLFLSSRKSTFCIITFFRLSVCLIIIWPTLPTWMHSHLANGWVLVLSLLFRSSQQVEWKVCVVHESFQPPLCDLHLLRSV